jgi:recombination protein RecA
MYHERKLLPTGLFSLDYISGGGYPEGGIAEIVGESGSGKTAAALRSIAFTQKQGGRCVFVDMDKAFPASLARSTGVDLPALVLLRPENAEDAFEMMSEIIKTDSVRLIVLDSVASLLPKEDIGKSVSKQEGALPKILQKELPAFISLLKTTRTTVVFLNQTRERNVRLGITTGTPGGRSLRYHEELRIVTSCGEMLRQGEDILGQGMKCTAVKSLAVFPGRTASFDVFLDSGADDIRFFADIAERHGFLSFSDNATILFDGQEFRSYRELRRFLKEDPGGSARIKKKLFRQKEARIVVLKKSIAIFPLVLFLAVPCFAQSLPDGGASFNNYQHKAQQRFERQKERNNSINDGVDAKKQEMDDRFEGMKKQFEKNGEHMGDDNGFMEKKAKEKLDTSDFEKNTPTNSLSDLKGKTDIEDDVTSRRGRAKDDSSADAADDDFAQTDSDEDSSKLNGFAKKYGLYALLGGGSLLGIFMYLFLSKEKSSVVDESEEDEKCG